MRRTLLLLSLLIAGCSSTTDQVYSSGALPLAIVSCACVIPDSGPIGPTSTEWDEPFLANHVQLTFAESFHKAGEAYFSPDGKWIIFQAVAKPAEGELPSEHYAMYVAELKEHDGEISGLNEPILVSPPGSANTCGWFHPHVHGRILFGCTLVPPSGVDVPGYQREQSKYRWAFPEEMTIVETVVPQMVGQEGPVKLNPIVDMPGYCAEGSWSPDGKTILYARVEPATQDADLYLHDMKSGKQRRIVAAPGYDGGPFFSPDGKMICYRSDREGNNLLQIQVSKLKMNEGVPVGIDGEFALTADRHVNWAPFFHPSGKWLVYATSRISHRNYEVFALSVDGDLSQRKTPVRITNATGFDGLPVFDPEGSMMMWTAQRGHDRNKEGRPSSQLWLAKTTGQSLPVPATTDGKKTAD
ncbi:MAG: hypothetical protein CMJ28_06290 [Phycisphaerae bacterium]|nr:hypothetical protein [Phycisphaerae bacterium]